MNYGIFSLTGPQIAITVIVAIVLGLTSVICSFVPKKILGTIAIVSFLTSCIFSLTALITWWTWWTWPNSEASAGIVFGSFILIVILIVVPAVFILDLAIGHATD